MSLSLSREECLPFYTRCFCEENVYRTIQQLQHVQSFAVFISNEARKVNLLVRTFLFGIELLIDIKMMRIGPNLVPAKC